MTGLAEKIVAIDDALGRARIPHAFGGALALAWCTQRAQVATRIRTESFAGSDVPFLSCTDLAVFKAFFNRTKDWADLEEMAGAGTLDIDRVIGVLVRYLGADDERIGRLRSL